MMNEPQDRELSRIYKDAEMPEPPQRIDEAILSASRRAAGSQPRSSWSGRVWRSRVPVALAATILLSFTVTLMVWQDSGEIDTGPVAKKPGTVEERAETAASTLPGARSTPDTGNRRERGGEKPALAEGSDASRPGFVRDAPIEPARAAPDSGEARTARESKVAAQALPAAPRAPAAAASPRREAALQRADGASGPAGSVAGGEAKQRRPETWIEDIRRLKAQGRTEDVVRELAEFRKRYPEYLLPEDLR
jgi:hypothetical protein